MVIKQFVLGLYENNCYVVRKDEDSKDCVVIDTALEGGPLVRYLQNNDLNPVAVILTHGHADHIGAVPELKEAFENIKVVIHKEDAKMLECSTLNLSMLGDVDVATGPADVIIEEEGEIEFAGVKFQTIFTPGHTQGGICFYKADEGVLFVGDTLFSGSIGRTDFPGYDERKCFEQLIGNIKSKLLVLDDETKVYTGHGPITTIGNEKKFNPYLN